MYRLISKRQTNKYRMKKTINIMLILISFNFIYSQSSDDFLSKSDKFLKEYVSNGKVSYSRIKKNDTSLKELMDLASGISVSKANALEYQSFWINAYNIAVISGVVSNYPIKSPLDVPGFFDKVKYNVGGKNITLNDIENKMLRAVFPNEARFHFVLVCAGLGCPPIINEAYLPSKLKSQLAQQTKKALDNPNFIVVEKGKVKVSQIFEWYKVDFEKNGKTTADFINKYKTQKLPEGSKINYYPYDWTLNEAK